MYAVMDSDALIKIAKSSIKETILSNISADIPKKVKQETVDEGIKNGYPDAIVISRNIQAGKIKVQETKSFKDVEQTILSLNLTGGEADAFRLFNTDKSYSCIITDDQKFIDLIGGLGVPYLTPSSLLVYLVSQKRITAGEAIRYLDKLEPMISEEEYILTKEELSK